MTPSGDVPGRIRAQLSGDRLGYAVSWTVVALLVSLKMGCEVALLILERFGSAVDPGLLGEIALFPRIGGLSLLPVVYVQGMPGPGVLVVMLLILKVRGCWLEHAQRRATRIGGHALFLRSFTDDPERPDQWQSVVDYLSQGMGQRDNVSLAYAASTEVQIVRALLGCGFGTIAVGCPGEHGTRFGALRVNLPSQSWQTGVSELMQGARVIVLRLRLSPGTQWEMRTLLRPELLERSIVLFEKGTFPGLAAIVGEKGLPLDSQEDSLDARMGVYVPATGRVHVLRTGQSLAARNQAVVALLLHWLQGRSIRYCSRGPRLPWFATLFAFAGLLLVPLVLGLSYPLAMLRDQEVVETTSSGLLDRRPDDAQWAFRLPPSVWDLPHRDRHVAIEQDSISRNSFTVYCWPTEVGATGRSLVVRFGAYTDRLGQPATIAGERLGGPVDVALRHRAFEGVPPHIRRELGIPDSDDVLLVEALDIQKAVSEARLTVEITAGVVGLIVAIIATATIWSRRRAAAALSALLEPRPDTT